jgi:hypothetical protein
MTITRTDIQIILGIIVILTGLYILIKSKKKIHLIHNYQYVKIKRKILINENEFAFKYRNLWIYKCAICGKIKENFGLSYWLLK